MVFTPLTPWKSTTRGNSSNKQPVLLKQKNPLIIFAANFFLQIQSKRQNKIFLTTNKYPWSVKTGWLWKPQIHSSNYPSTLKIVHLNSVMTQKTFKTLITSPFRKIYEFIFYPNEHRENPHNEGSIEK